MEIKLTLQLKDKRYNKPPTYERTIWVAEEDSAYCGLDLNILIREFKIMLRRLKNK